MTCSNTKLHLIVCVKQLFDPYPFQQEKKNSFSHREAVLLNPFDGYALEAAARLKEKNPLISITALSVGHPQEEGALRQALAIAADRACLAVVPNPDALDALAVAQLLAQTIHRLEEKWGEADLIFCGQQSADSQSAQVGPQLAQLMKLPFLGGVLEATLPGNILQGKQEVQQGLQLAEANLPCVAAFAKPVWEPRLPTIKSSMAASRAEITVLEMTEIPSPAITIDSLRPTPQRACGTLIAENNGEAAAQRLFHLLSGVGVLPIK